MHTTPIQHRALSSKPKSRISEPNAHVAVNVIDDKIRFARQTTSRSAPTPRTTHFFRVSKAKNPKNPHPSPVNPDLAQQCSDQLDEYREQIYETTEVDLTNTEAALTERISELGDEFRERLSLLSTREGALAVSLADERLQVPDPNTKDKQGTSSLQEVRLGDRAEAFRGFVKSKKQELCAHFAEWNKVQTKLITLAVQVLGPEALHIEEGQLHDGLMKAIKEAAAAYDQADEDFRAQQHEIDEIEQALRSLSRETNEELVIILRDFKVEQKRRQKVFESAKVYLEGFK